MYRYNITFYSFLQEDNESSNVYDHIVAKKNNDLRI